MTRCVKRGHPKEATSFGNFQFPTISTLHTTDIQHTKRQTHNRHSQHSSTALCVRKKNNGVKKCKWGHNSLRAKHTNLGQHLSTGQHRWKETQHWCTKLPTYEPDWSINYTLTIVVSLSFSWRLKYSLTFLECQKACSKSVVLCTQHWN